MEPLDDQELDQLLRHASRPQVPGSLAARIFVRRSWWRRFWNAEIRVPLPLGIAALLALLLFGALAFRERPAPRPQVQPVSLKDLQPVQQVQIHDSY